MKETATSIGQGPGPPVEVGRLFEAAREYERLGQAESRARQRTEKGERNEDVADNDAGIHDPYQKRAEGSKHGPAQDAARDACQHPIAPTSRLDVFQDDQALQ